MAKKLVTAEEPVLHWAIALAGGPELGTTGSKLASSNFADFLDLPIAARRFAGSEFRVEPWACDHAAS